VSSRYCNSDGTEKGVNVGRDQGKLTGLLLAAAACCLLGACGHSGHDSGAPLVKRHADGTAASAAANSTNSGPTDLVSAVSSGGAGDGPVGLKFQLGQRPVAGQPVIMRLRLVANQSLAHLEARFHPDDGLEIREGGDFDPEGPMDAGAAVDHSLTLVPDRDGVYTVMATVTTGAAAEGVSRSFVIPIVVGVAPAAAPAVP
jgi:hypothetical protein